MSTTAQKIEIMQAFADGKTIEYKCKGHDRWGEARTPQWNWSANDFRIKPEPPREFWVNVYTNGLTSGLLESAARAEHLVLCNKTDFKETIHLIEVK